MTSINISSKASRIQFFPEGAGAAIRARIIEFAGVGVMVAAGALLVALAGYDSGDPSLNTAAAGTGVRNPLGVPGALVADLLMQTLGFASIAVGVVLLAWGWGIVRHHRVHLFWIRATLLPVGICAAAYTLEHVPVLPETWSLSSGLGGSIGYLLRFWTPGPYGFGIHPWLATGLLAVLATGLLLCLLGFTGREMLSVLSGLRRAVAFVTVLPLRAVRRLRLRQATPAKRRKSARRRAAARERRVDPVIDLDIAAGKHAGKHAGEQLEQTGGQAKTRTGSAELQDHATAASQGGRVLPRIDPTGTMRAKRAVKPTQARLDLRGPDDGFVIPSPNLLNPVPLAAARARASESELEQNAQVLQGVLEDFNVHGEIVRIRPGPVVTLYELDPAPGTRTSRVIGLAHDIARSMCAASARIVSIPGQNVIGIELPNAERETVYLREILASKEYAKKSCRLPLALGKDISGNSVIADLAGMPHLLVAGTTGSGKSVGLNAMILSLLFRFHPEECRMIMIDPKMLELSVYNDIPHLLVPVVTDPRRAVVALKWVVREMEQRYEKMNKLGVRNLEGYNKRIKEAAHKGETLTRQVQAGFDAETGDPVVEEEPLDMMPLPYIVVVVDEMADLMLVASKDALEVAIQRLSQMARAAGIHLIMATQRPSVNVVTGTIKANFPTRISFQVTSQIDSKTILNEAGAEQLLGQGDMLFMAGGRQITRVHGPFVDDAEIEAIARHLRAQGEPIYIEEVTFDEDDADADPFAETEGSGDDLYDRAVALVCRERKASTSFVQRHLAIGYNRAARLIDRMESQGVISSADRVGRREVLAGDQSAAGHA